VTGLIRPKIYLPCGLSGREQEYIILHEQHHIRRFDHIFKVLAFLTLCVHWFNPLVWLAFALAFYLVFQTKNGETYLAYGWGDPGERDQAESGPGRCLKDIPACFSISMIKKEIR